MQKTILFLLVSGILAGCAAKFTADHQALLQKQLKDMVDVDQIAANIPQGKYKELPREEWEKFKDSVFTSNKVQVEIIFDQYGFPGFDKVGKEGSQHFWLLVQHCDKYPEFQKRY
ncbi:hypothetical protein [Niabella hibiscisoli]|uniref:hypothetical protein n=1 Tax=Niabella hibiscisoli TaxID=1825928 RepID=UPI001F10732A|nr:hypothetical protein [Niabella hibiscisoli]MCH5715586.1 hypothetical protein [Niabella hibiscisoli]